MNVMKKIRVDKITLNMGTGGPGDRLEKALKLLKTISGKKPVATSSMKRIPTWSVRPGLKIGAKVTVRGKEAANLLKNLLRAINNLVPEKKFDKFGNVSFGIPEYIEIPGMEYDPQIGIIGLEVSVTLARPGFNIKYRNKKIGKKHLISKEEAIEFMKKNFEVKTEE